MTDTRKDKRAPVSLKVRFKSATVDEFVEHYSRDISHGGLFIKSKQPMAIGTLLKFELQLKDESKLIQGVGRVVWKREAADGGTDDNPAGMGIKFIKMDPESRTLVDKMVDQRGAEPGQYEAGGGDKDAKDDDGVVASSPQARPVRSAKATMQFFPSAGPTESELPAPEDRTQVRQASEFLAAALAEGGADDLASKEAEVKAEEARKRTDEIEKEREAAAQRAKDEAETKERAEKEARERAEREKTDREKAEREKAEADAKKRESDEAAKKADEAKKAAEAKADAAKKTAAAAESKATAEKAPAEKKGATDKKAVEDRPRVKVTAAATPPAEPSSNTLPIILVGLVLVGVIGYFAFAGGEAEPTTPPTTTTTTTATEPTEPEPTEPTEAEGTEPTEAEGTEPTEAEGTEPTALQGEPATAELVAAAPAISFRVETTPPGAEIRVGNELLGTSPATVELPAGEATLLARLVGYRDQSSTVTVAEGQRPVRLTLEALPYRIEIVTNPPGATVRAAGRSGTAPATLTITRPTRDTRVTAALAGHTTTGANVAATAFAATGDAMLARIEINLVPAPSAPSTGSGQRRAAPEGGSEGSEAGDPSSGGSTSQPEPSEPSTPSTPEPSGGSGRSGGGEDEAPPDNPF